MTQCSLYLYEFNLLRNNLVVANASHGVYFRNEPEYTGGHRNRLESNQIFNNGTAGEGNGITIDGETNDTIIVGNQIGNKAEYGSTTQQIGVMVGAKTQRTEIDQNQMTGHLKEDLVYCQPTK